MIQDIPQPKIFGIPIDREIRMDNERITIKDAMNRLKQAMIEEPYYAHAWNRNIAQACYESMDSQPWVSLTEKGISKRHKIANESATTFMKRFFDVETSKDMLLKDNNNNV